MPPSCRQVTPSPAKGRPLQPEGALCSQEGFLSSQEGALTSQRGALSSQGGALPTRQVGVCKSTGRPSSLMGVLFQRTRRPSAKEAPPSVNVAPPSAKAGRSLSQGAPPPAKGAVTQPTSWSAPSRRRSPTIKGAPAVQQSAPPAIGRPLQPRGVPSSQNGALSSLHPLQTRGRPLQPQGALSSQRALSPAEEMVIKLFLTK